MSPETYRPDDDAREAVRGLPEPQADAVYRDRLLRQFASGTIPSATRGWRSQAWTVAFVAATAIGLAFVLNRPPRWTVEGVSGSGTVVVDGRELTVDDAERIRRAVRPGSRIGTSGDAQLDLRLDRVMAIQVTPGTQAILPSAPGRWWPAASRAEIRAGEVRFTTGPQLRGLRIDTPEARIQVVGTTFAVIREPTRSCVCVLEGEVQMSGRNSSSENVRGGTRRSLYNDGRLPVVEPIGSMDTVKLTMLRDRVAPRLGR